MEYLIPVAYVVYTILQGALVNRFYLEDETAPVGATIICAIFAPVVSIALVGSLFYKGIKWVAMPPKK